MNIFQDLQIDYSNMMTDPQDFHQQCVNEAEKLKDILKADISVEHILKTRLENEEVTPELAADIKATISNVYTSADNNYSVNAMVELASQLKQLAKDLEYLARDKIMLEMSATNPSIDKSLAFDLYKELREKHNSWIDAMQMLAGFNNSIDASNLEKLQPMPGNYGKPVNLIHYIFRVDDEDDIYRTHNAVLHRLVKDGKLSYDQRHMNLMDAVDLFRSTPELNVQVTERAE